jgi:hypothetical protein
MSLWLAWNHSIVLSFPLHRGHSGIGLVVFITTPRKIERQKNIIILLTLFVVSFSWLITFTFCINIAW